jgi:excisionase family DNA binding protein
MKFYKISEVAEMFGVSRQAVYKWINENKIKSVTTPAGTKRITQEEIDKLIKGVK